MLLFKGKINTKIGRLHYLWFEDAGGEPVVVYMGIGIDASKSLDTDEGFLKGYIEKLKRSLNRHENLTIREKDCEKVSCEIHKYFEGTSGEIKLTYKFLTGTEFERRVWAETSKIAYGKTLSYGELAALIKNPRACRAAGSALGENPLMLIVPCHRVIRADRSLGGFGGGLKVKRFLLDLEKS